MPTGYTAGILDGKITTFKDFAIKCTRAFNIDMRDADADAEYTPREVSNFYRENLERTMSKIEELEKVDLKVFEESLVTMWNERINSINNSVQNRKEGAEILQVFLAKAREYTPPTDKHEGFKNFMIEQLETTLDYDGSIDYYNEELLTLSKTLASYNVEEERARELENLKKDLDYYTKNLNDEIVRVNESNKWMADVFKSLE